MGIFSRRKTSTSPYACEEAIESTSSFGSISHTPYMSRAHLPLTEEPEPMSSFTTGHYAVHAASAIQLGSHPTPRPRRPRLVSSASTHNLHAVSYDAPPLPRIPAHYHSQSISSSHYSNSGYNTPMSSPPIPASPPHAQYFNPTPARSTPNLLAMQPPNRPAHQLHHLGTSTANASRIRLGQHKEASASRVSLATAGKSLARVPSLWKRKFRRSQNSTGSDSSDSSRDSKRR